MRRKDKAAGNGTTRDPVSWLAALSATLLLGAAGGAVLNYFNVPLAWMIGAMCATTIASLMGAPLLMPMKLRNPMVAILGVMLGSAFAPGMMERIVDWLPTMGGLFLYVSAVTGLLFVYFRRVWGYDRVTAYCSASPGGLALMVVVGGELGGDEKTIALIQAARILLVVLLVPLGFMLFDSYAAGPRPPLGPSLTDIPPGEIGVMGLCAVLGPLAARLLRLPAAFLTGPMVLSAAAHLTGLTASSPPFELVAIAQVVIGCSVGCRFTGVPVRKVLQTLAVSVGATTIMIALTLLFSLALAPMVAASFPAIVLAFSPGGLAEMSLIALALGIEAAFVSTHHIVRIMLLAVAAPAFFRSVTRRGARLADQAKPD